MNIFNSSVHNGLGNFILVLEMEAVFYSNSKFLLQLLLLAKTQRTLPGRLLSKGRADLLPDKAFIFKGHMPMETLFHCLCW